MPSLHFGTTQYGLEYGNAKTTRLFGDDKNGSVTIGLETSKYNHKGVKKSEIQIYITKTGKVRIFSKGEWEPPQ